MRYFDWYGFRSYYLAKSKLEKKSSLVQDFWQIWYDKFGYSLTHSGGVYLEDVKKRFTAPNKKDIKVKLVSKGYSSASIDSLFKYFSEWLKASTKAK